MPAQQQMTVAPAKSGNGWSLNISGGAETRYRTKEAVRAGASKGRSNGHAQLIIKGRNGRIQNERTYGADPRRTRVSSSGARASGAKPGSPTRAPGAITGRV
jgi:hypothetical protein